jgi:DNA polymerase-2
MERQIEGFISSGSSFDYDDKLTLKFYGQSTEGSFVVLINDFKNYFFKESKNSTGMRSLEGHWVEKIEFLSQGQLKNKNGEIQSSGLRTFEADIRPIERYLMDKRLYAQVNIKGQAQVKNNILTFENPKILVGNHYPHFKILSIDIETGKDGRLLSLAYCFRSKEGEENRCCVLGKGVDTQEVFFSPTEKGLLDFFQQAVKRLDPDIITGWNVIGFDFKFLENKSKSLQFPIMLGRNNRPLEMYQNARGEWNLNLEGRVIIDGPMALKMNFFSFESYSLHNVSKALLGEGKDIDQDEVHDKWGEIERRFREDKMALARYNIKDAVLVLDIFEKIDIMGLFINRSMISGLLMERVGGSTAAFDHFFLPPLHDEGFVANNVEDVKYLRPVTGGFVLNPVVGIHSYVLVMDFKSLYPTIIRTFTIDPLSRVCKDENPVSTPKNIVFSQDRNILPKKISELLERRSQAKKEKNAPMSQAVKILMNSFYGVMGSVGCRFYHEDLPDAITSSGHWVLKTVIGFLEQEQGLKVLYGDTDSIFVQLPSLEGHQQYGSDLVNKVNTFLSEKIKNDFLVESHLEIQYDKFFKKLVLTATRGEGEGAKKRYAGLTYKEKDGQVSEEMVLTGMEYVRSDWSMLARNFQYELYRRLFNGEDLGTFIRETIAKLENHELNHELILTKRLSKSLDEYTKNVPPQAKAAKLLYEAKGIVTRRPRYVMTLRGPIPVELPHDDIDYEYYIDRQIAPIAESILQLLGESFADIHAGQLSLF